MCVSAVDCDMLSRGLRGPMTGSHKGWTALPSDFYSFLRLVMVGCSPMHEGAQTDRFLKPHCLLVAPSLSLLHKALFSGKPGLIVQLNLFPQDPGGKHHSEQHLL